MAALWTVEYVGGAIRVRRHRSQANAEAYRDAVLRENLHCPGGSADDDERVRREYSHRFIVRGFWRDQAYGPNHSLRRRQWIPPFVKGPADKPLICKETVRIWKR